jgi:hypothetical protein
MDRVKRLENADSILDEIKRMMPEGLASPWLNKRQAASYLGCHPNYIARLERAGRLRAYVLNYGTGKKSGTKRYRREDLDNSLQPL